MKRLVCLTLALALMCLLLPGCAASPASAKDAYLDALEGAEWVMQTDKAVFLEEWSEPGDGVTTYYRRYLVYGKANALHSDA